jgi:hypothetical protein
MLYTCLDDPIPTQHDLNKSTEKRMGLKIAYLILVNDIIQWDGCPRNGCCGQPLSPQKTIFEPTSPKGEDIICITLRKNEHKE